MSDNAELQARIDALSGQINNKRKQQTSSHALHQQPHFSRGAERWTPYGRGGHATFQPHKNRTLVLGGNQQAARLKPAGSASIAETATTPSDAFVTARRAGVNQLMSKEAFERQQKKQLERLGDQLRVKRQTEHKNIVPTDTNKAAPDRELKISGIRFQVLNDGSKLIRLSDFSTDTQETPKRASIAGVDFLRTKHGNLIRAIIPKSAQRHSKIAAKPQCENFTKHGNCTFGPGCRFTHDPTKVSVCKDFLRNGFCKSGSNCDLSHELTYHRVPACTHFLRGNCTNSACRYPHIKTPSTAPVCRAFATLGYCSKGPDCERRHVLECPEYSNHGRCDDRERGSCLLPHIDRAGTLRKAAKRQAKTGSEDESDMSSDEKEYSDQDMVDFDSDVAEDGPAVRNSGDTHALSQQQDFVALT